MRHVPQLPVCSYAPDKLTPEHVDFISEHWSFINSDIPVIKKYFRHILTLYDISAGIFTKSNPSYPVSWTTYSDLGHVIALYTLPEYRRKGFPLVVAANVYAQLLQKGIVPFGEKVPLLRNMENMFLTVLGEIASLGNTIGNDIGNL